MSQEIALTFDKPPICGVERIEIKFVATRDIQGQWEIIVAKPMRIWTWLEYMVWRKGAEIAESHFVESPIDCGWMDAVDKSRWNDWCEYHYGESGVAALEKRHQELIRRTEQCPWLPPSPPTMSYI
jgi:hypothetical protein